MNSLIKNIIVFVALIYCSTGSAQISIPYGNDAILVEDSSRIDLRFELHGNDWNCRYVSYIFLNGTNDIAGTNEQDAVRRAFDSWSAVTNLDFVEACNEIEADIRISWETNNHGDGNPFDGEDGVLAHAFFPPPNAGILAGDVHFDDDEVWNLDDDIDMETVALHELGHSLGLRHSDVNNSVMEDIYEGERRDLTQDDIDGIRAIYGNREYPLTSNDDYICLNETTILRLDDFACLDNDFPVEWTTSNHLEIENGQGTGEIIVRGINEGLASIIVTIDSGCDVLEYNIELVVGPPIMTGPVPNPIICVN